MGLCYRHFSVLVLSALTLGSIGEEGRSFLDDLKQADSSNIISAFFGGIIFNAANILFSAAIAIAGMAVLFPCYWFALVFGVIVNYAGAQKGDPIFICGVGLVAIAIIINAIAYRKSSTANQKVSTKGIMISLMAGVLMSFFYRFIAHQWILKILKPAAGKMTPYTAVFIFSVGIFLSNFIFNTILMRKPFQGAPTITQIISKEIFHTWWVCWVV